MSTCAMRSDLMRLPRRQVLAWLGALAGAAAAPLARAQARRPVVVLSAYPEEVTARFEAAFEKAHPGYRMQLVWQMPNAVPDDLRTAAGEAVDVVWLASPRTFDRLKRVGAWRTLSAQDVPRDGLPTHIGGTAISDPDGQYLATEVAGYGYVYQPQRLATLGLSVPQDWDDLAQAAWARQIALPVPSRVGFAPVLVDIVLQAYGWQRGWALWSAIAGNAQLVGNGSTFITDEVASGRAALGLTIDFFAASAVSKGAPLRFAYPAHGGINPAHIAVRQHAPNPDGALAFVRFVLSAEGQALLAHPSIRKLAVRPSAYAGRDAADFNPFDAAARGGYGYDNALGQPRLGLLSALFEQALVVDHADHMALWQRLHAAEAAGRPAAAARALLEAPPVAAAVADAALMARFQRTEGSAQPSVSALEQAWRQAATQRRQQAGALLA